MLWSLLKVDLKAKQTDKTRGRRLAAKMDRLWSLGRRPAAEMEPEV